MTIQDRARGGWRSVAVVREAKLRGVPTAGAVQVPALHCVKASVSAKFMQRYE